MKVEVCELGKGNIFPLYAAHTGKKLGEKAKTRLTFQTSLIFRRNGVRMEGGGGMPRESNSKLLGRPRKDANALSCE